MSEENIVKRDDELDTIGRRIGMRAGQEKEPSAKEIIFADLIASGETATNAYQRAYGTTNVTTAGAEGHKSLKKPKIHRLIEERKAQYREMADVRAADVIGALQEMAFASVEDVLDEQGNFSMALAKENGALKLIKKITATPMKDGTTKTVVEFYPRDGALNQLCDVLGIRFAPKENDARARLIDAVNKIMKVEGLTFGDALMYVATKQKESSMVIWTLDLITQVAKEHSVDLPQDLGGIS